MMIFYQIMFWIMLLIVAWLLYAVINILKAMETMQKSDDSVLECLRLLLGMKGSADK